MLYYPAAPLLLSHACFYATALSLSNPRSPSLAHPLAMPHCLSFNWAVQRRLEAATGPEERRKIVACMWYRPHRRPPNCYGYCVLQKAPDCEEKEICFLNVSEMLRRSLEGKWAALACHETRLVVVQNAFETLEESAKDGIVDKLLGQGAAVFGEGARAWGTLGHATVAYVAQNYLTPTAAAWAKTVLNDTSTSYLANTLRFNPNFRLAAKWPI
ncbi:hypothetical protein B0H13DRAFT_2682373 [Mycena leptocephala]|nr:hypothetical protein B0H13DRAFT_2682373 [Mycena leptocephala]